MSDKLREIVSNMTAGPWAYVHSYGAAWFSGPEGDTALAVKYLYNNNALGIATLRNNADLLLDMIDAALALTKGPPMPPSPEVIALCRALHVLGAKIGDLE